MCLALLTSMAVALACDAGPTEPVGSTPTVMMAKGGIPNSDNGKGNLSSTDSTTTTSDSTTTSSDSTSTSTDDGSTTTDGTSSSAGLAFEDSFDSGQLAGAQNGISWAGLTNMAVSSTNPYQGGYALRGTYANTYPSNGHRVEASFNLPPLSEFWLEYMVYIDTDWAVQENPDGVDNKKWLDVKSRSGSGGNALTWLLELGVSSAAPDQAFLQMPIEADEGTADYVYTGKKKIYDGFITPAMRGTWRHMRVHVKMATTRGAAGKWDAPDGAGVEGNGVVEIWWGQAGGTLTKIYHRTDVPLLAINSTWGSEGPFVYGYLLGAPNSGYASETSYDIDNVRFYTADPGWR